MAILNCHVTFVFEIIILLFFVKITGTHLAATTVLTSSITNTTATYTTGKESRKCFSWSNIKPEIYYDSCCILNKREYLLKLSVLQALS